MHSQCPGYEESTPSISSTPVPVSVPSIAPQSDMEEELGTQCVEETCVLPSPPQEFKVNIKKNDTWTSLTAKGKVLHVPPPQVSKMLPSVQLVESQKCLHENCRLLVPWFKGGISRQDLNQHFSDLL